MPDVHRAPAVFPGSGPALLDGALVLDARGVVLDVGPSVDVLPRHAGARAHLHRGVLVPGLVNAHVHVELSALRGRVPGGAGFVPWVERLLALRAAQEAEDEGATRASIDEAVEELRRAGTVAVGEVTNTLAATRSLARAKIAGVVFHEVAGMPRETALLRVEELSARALQAVNGWPTHDLVHAPAPHALYSTHPDAVRALLAQARARGLRSSLHLAEHAAERAFLERGEGPFEGFARGILERKGGPERGRERTGDRPAGGLPFPVPGTGPVEYALRLGALAPDVLAVHLADATEEEIAKVADAGAPVVLCPRSNLHIELRLPPLLALLARGVVPALGTDSLASNASLDVLAEARALVECFPGVAGPVLLEMATSAGARALDRPDLGRLARGARPGVLLIEGDLPESAEPCAWALRQPLAARRWIDGRG